MVATGHTLATLEGVRVLKESGNAFDAAVAVAATLAVVRPQMCGIGGDVFMLLYPAGTGQVEALNGNGAAPGLADPSRLDSGALPLTGVLPVTVPGAVAGWLSLHERHGTMPLEQLFEPAISYARDGYPMYPHLFEDVRERAAVLSQEPALAEIFLRNGQPLPVGAPVRQPALARTLAAIVAGGRDAFYRGQIAEQIGDYFKQAGGWLRADDLASHTTRWSEPLRTTYRDVVVYEQPPSSQGFMLLTELSVVEHDDLAALGHLTADSIHVMVEAKKLAFADRDQYLGDTDHVDVPMDWLLSKEHARTLREQVDTSRTRSLVSSTMRGHDTTYFAIVDRDGNAVSGIQSLSHAFGGGAFAAEAGVIFNNRMTSFTLEPGHPNVLAGGKKPVHTLNTYLVTDHEGLLVVGGTPGGDGQVQTNLQVITGIVDYGLSPQQAIEAPRWISGEQRWVSAADTLRVEARMPEDVRAGLERRGHQVRVIEPWDQWAGSAKVVRVDRATGSLQGGADSRRDAAAQGF
jgi:gamma-glutamyltranspeptidase/glutathione hydrolase